MMDRLFHLCTASIRSLMGRMLMLAYFLHLTCPMDGQSLANSRDSLLRIWNHQAGSLSESARLEAGHRLQKIYAQYNPNTLLMLSKEMEAYGLKNQDNWWRTYGFYGIGIHFSKTGKPDSAILAFKHALAICPAQSSAIYPLLLAETGKSFLFMGKIDSSITYYKTALPWAIKFSPPQELGSLYNNLAGPYMDQRKYLEALNYFQEAQKYADAKVQTYISINIGIIMNELSISSTAREHYKKAVEWAEKSQSPPAKASAYSAMVFGGASNLSEMRQWLKKGLKIATETQQREPYFRLLISAGTRYLDSLQYDSAKAYFDLILQNSKIDGSASNENLSKLYLAVICLKQQQFKKSIQWCRQIQPYFEQTKYHVDLIILYNTLSYSFAGLKQLDSALVYLQKKDILRDSTEDSSLNKNLISEYMDYRYKKDLDDAKSAKEHSEALAQEAHSRATLTLGLFGMIILILVGSLLFLYAYSQQKKRSAAQLFSINQDLQHERHSLQESNQKLGRFSAIVSHDILSNLDLILSSGNVFVGNNYRPDGLKKYYDMSQHTARQLKSYCLSLLEEARQSQPQNQPFHNPMPIVEAVLQHYNLPLKNRGFQVEVSPLPPTQLPPAVIEQILHNLISNAIRHVVSDHPLKLEIKPESSAPGNKQWVVVDNGNGIPPERLETIFSTTSNSSHQTGQHLGLALLKDTLKQYDADIWAENIPTGGAKFVISTSSRTTT